MAQDRISTPANDRRESIYRVGERVDVTIRGAVVVDVNDDAIVLSLGDDHALTGIAFASAVTVARVAPVEWPPQIGDLWRAQDGGLWFAQSEDGATVLASTGSLTRQQYPDSVLRKCGPMTLVHREPEPVWCVSCEQDGHTEDTCPRHVTHQCGATSFSEPHEFVGATLADIEEAHNDCWELCGKDSDDQIHRCICGAPVGRAHKRDCPYLVDAELDAREGGDVR